MMESGDRNVSLLITSSTAVMSHNQSTELQGVACKSTETPVEMDTHATPPTHTPERVNEPSSSQIEPVNSPPDVTRKSCEAEALPLMRDYIGGLMAVLTLDDLFLECPNKEWYLKLSSHIILIEWLILVTARSLANKSWSTMRLRIVLHMCGTKLSVSYSWKLVLPSLHC